MTKPLTPASDLHDEWMKKPAYAEAFAELDGEFALASALIKARTDAGLTQEQVAGKMQTTRTAIARLEGGQHMPSTRTLAKFAEATGHQLQITFKKAAKVRGRKSA